MEENREQPIIMPAHALNPAYENGAMSEVGSQNQDGKLGKFKSVEALMDAYDSLQAEFTKKCQMLSEMKAKVLRQEQQEENPQDNQVQSVNENEEEKFDEQGLADFLAQHSEAKEFEEEIKSNLSSVKNKSPFEVAWADVVLSSLKDKRHL